MGTAAATLTAGSIVFCDKGYISHLDATAILSICGVHFVAIRRRSMGPNPWTDEFDLCRYRKRIETACGQLGAMGLQGHQPRTNYGIDLII